MEKLERPFRQELMTKLTNVHELSFFGSMKISMQVMQ